MDVDDRRCVSLVRPGEFLGGVQVGDDRGPRRAVIF